jgi:hypothetical protein
MVESSVMDGIVWIVIFVAVAIAGAAVLAAIFAVIWQQAGAPIPDNVPIRLGVFLLGAIALTCLAGLFYLSTLANLFNSGDQSNQTGQNTGETALLAQQQGQQGVTDSLANITSEAVSNTSDAQALGLSGQIVALLGTIAGAAVAGIAGLLIGPGRTEPPPDSADARGGETAGGGGGEFSPTDSPTNQLRLAAVMRRQGDLTDTEYEEAKQHLLAILGKSAK